MADDEPARLYQFLPTGRAKTIVKESKGVI